MNEFTGNYNIREIGLKELFLKAQSMKWYDFENWVANKLYDIPPTVDSTEITDKLKIKGLN